MYKIVEGKIYNIEEAEKIYQYTTLAPEATYKIEAAKIICEIYQTRKGNFFMIERLMGRERFIPIQKEEVIKTFEKRDEIELIKEHFLEHYSSLIEM